MKSQTLFALLDSRLKDQPPSRVFLGGALCAAFCISVYDIARTGDAWVRARDTANRGLRRLLKSVISKKIRENVDKIHFPVAKSADGRSVIVVDTFNELPAVGLSDDTVIAQCDARRKVLDNSFTQVRLSGVVYGNTSDSRSKLLSHVVSQQLWANPLFADYFGTVRKMEAEVSRMVAALFVPDRLKGIVKPVTTYTFGGSESVILAMLAYRNHARDVRGITEPNMVVPVSVHPAFDKGAMYFGIRLIKVPCDPVTFRADVRLIESYMTKDTIAIAGSTPCYPWGVVDPIRQLNDLALRKGVGLHVDACVGGFYLPFLKEAGLDAFEFDFSLPAVTSISCDIHKFGAAPKGASAVVFRDEALRSHATFACADFPGGLYVTAGVSGSKPGYAIAAAWATLVATGRQGYVESARGIRRAVETISRGVSACEPHLRLLATPDVSIVAITSDTIDVYAVMESMKKKGWLMNGLQFPSALHVGVTWEHTKPGVAEAFVADLRAIAAELGQAAQPGKALPTSAHMYGSTQAVHDRTIVADVLKGYVEQYYKQE